MQNIKGYDAQAIGKLSPRKKAFVQAVLEGINTGIDTAPANGRTGAIKTELENMTHRIKNNLQQAGGQIPEIVAFQLLKGDLDQNEIYNDDSFMSAISKNLGAFAKDNDNRLAPASKDKSGEMGMGATAAGKLINGLTHPDPEQRTNVKEALNNSIFKDERLDNPAVGQLLLKISQVDVNNLTPQDKAEIQQLAQQLQG